tara:strand:- start:16776 stop:17219 length:444 start_codon:yes stop_codon:yes gene_type:complete
MVDIEDLKNVFENAIDETSDSNVEYLTSGKITEHKNKIFDDMGLSGNEREKAHKSLEFYRYISDLNDFKYGMFIRWYSLKKLQKRELKLEMGGFISDIKIVSNDVHIVCKTIFGKHIQIKSGENIIFQKITDQEKVIISVVDYVNKK